VNLRRRWRAIVHCKKIAQECLGEAQIDALYNIGSGPAFLIDLVDLMEFFVPQRTWHKA
jgi:hypothetical protein